MNFTISDNQVSSADQKLISFYYQEFARKLLAYTLNHYLISEDDATTLVYKTVYKMAEVHHKYEFTTEKKRNAFVFTSHINFIRNYFRDDKTFENKNISIDLETADRTTSQGIEDTNNTALRILQQELEKLPEWQRILLLMRGQGMPYSEIVSFVDRPEKQLKVYYGRLKKQLYDKVNEEVKKLNQTKNEK
jgi:DNA-directed RNA polymerase specialized sigma24 family protein